MVSYFSEWDTQIGAVPHVKDSLSATCQAKNLHNFMEGKVEFSELEEYFRPDAYVVYTGMEGYMDSKLPSNTILKVTKREVIIPGPESNEYLELNCSFISYEESHFIERQATVQICYFQEPMDPGNLIIRLATKDDLENQIYNVGIFGQKLEEQIHQVSFSLVCQHGGSHIATGKVIPTWKTSGLPKLDLRILRTYIPVAFVNPEDIGYLYCKTCDKAGVYTELPVSVADLKTVRPYDSSLINHKVLPPEIRALKEIRLLANNYYHKSNSKGTVTSFDLVLQI